MDYNANYPRLGGFEYNMGRTATTKDYALMSDTYLAFHVGLLKLAYNNLIAQPPFNQADISEVDGSFLDKLEGLIHDADEGEIDYALGQDVICRIPAAYPELMPTLPRDLLWFFGGDCLHYMPDEEIEEFQKLDEARFEAQASDADFNYEAMRMLMISTPKQAH